MENKLFIYNVIIVCSGQTMTDLWSTVYTLFLKLSHVLIKHLSKWSLLWPLSLSVLCWLSVNLLINYLSYLFFFDFLWLFVACGVLILKLIVSPTISVSTKSSSYSSSIRTSTKGSSSGIERSSWISSSSGKPSSPESTEWSSTERSCKLLTNRVFSIIML